MTDIRPEPSSDDECNAYYEAGHAVIASLGGLEIKGVSIDAEGDAVSWIDVREPDLSPRRLQTSSEARSSARAVIRALLAGPAAQERYSFGECAVSFNISHRYMIAEPAAWRAISLAGSFPNKGHALIPPLWREVTRTIQTPKAWAAIEAVATALLHDGKLAGSEVQDIMEQAMRVIGTSRP